mmetsp:Transcript_31698/g.48548  ORF Transcript_31698/g.48548 Transcript_31698/m.48548 type:complete len:199 (+) Transcript_31698:2484-3080(+)
MQKLDLQKDKFGKSVNYKMFSFLTYLREISFKGFAKWYMLNFTVKQFHPSKQGIEDIIRNGRTPTHEASKSLGVDPIYSGLLKQFPDKFLNLTPQEQRSMLLKQTEYQSLLKKGVLINFVLINMDPTNIRDSLLAFNYLEDQTKSLSQRINNYQVKMAEYDSIAVDALKIFIGKHMVNMTKKYASQVEAERDDSLKSA